MKIRFSNHAKERCKQRKFSEQWIAARLQRIPLSDGVHEHVLDGTDIKVVFQDSGSYRSVITLYSVPLNESKPKPKKQISLAPIQDILQKEKQKFKRRRKNSKKNKPPRR